MTTLSLESRRTALLVEDDPDDEELIVRALRKAGIASDVAIVQDGAEAIEYLFGIGSYEWRDARILPQVVLLDLNLPKLSGLEVLRRIRENAHTRSLPVVIFTSSAEQEDQIRSFELGANGFVRKPVSFEQFVEAFRQLRRVGLHRLMSEFRYGHGGRGKPA